MDAVAERENGTVVADHADEWVSFGDLPKVGRVRAERLTLDSLAGSTVGVVGVTVSGDARKRYALTLDDGRSVGVPAAVASRIQASGKKVRLTVTATEDGGIHLS